MVEKSILPSLRVPDEQPGSATEVRNWCPAIHVRPPEGPKAFVFTRLVIEFVFDHLDIDSPGIFRVDTAVSLRHGGTVVVPDVFARCIPNAHAPWKFVILGHPDLAVGIDCDAGGHQQAARLVGTDPGPPAGFTNGAEESSIGAEGFNLHGGAAVRDHRVATLVECEPPRARQLPGGKGRRRTRPGIDAQ